MGRDKDAQFDSEFNHPPEARGPWANEVVEDRQRAIYCQACKEKGRKQMAHRVLPGRRGICNWCYRGEPHPEDVRGEGERGPGGPRPGGGGRANVCGRALPGILKAEAKRLGLVIGDQVPTGKPLKNWKLAEPASHFSTTNEEPKEEAMAEKCKCGRPQTHRGRCWARRGLKAAPGAKGMRGKRAAATSEASKPAHRANGAANGAGEPVTIPVAALDRWFESLGEKERAELQGRLWSQLPAELKALVFADEVGA